MTTQRAINTESSLSRTLVPRLDHVMVLLDSAAYAEVADQQFLRERFATIKEKRADSSVAGQYSTLGVAGRNTFVELFDAALPAAAPLTGGLVFSFETPGSSEWARARLDDGAVAYQYQLVTRAVAGTDEQQPWYHLINVDLGAGSPLVMFLNEVTPEYFTSAGAQPTPDGALTREAYLDAVMDRRPNAARLVRDVAAVTVLVTRDRAARITAALTPFGYRSRVLADGLEELTGHELALRLRIGDWPRDRVAEVELRLEPGPSMPKAAVELGFGTSSRLVIEPGGLARWTFEMTPGPIATAHRPEGER